MKGYVTTYVTNGQCFDWPSPYMAENVGRAAGI